MHQPKETEYAKQTRRTDDPRCGAQGVFPLRIQEIHAGGHRGRTQYDQHCDVCLRHEQA